MLCTRCAGNPCARGRVDLAPAECPMRGPFPDFDELYGAEPDRRLAYHAALIEAEGYCRWTRAHETAELCRRMGFARVGVAHCRDTAAEAGLVASFLRSRGLVAILPDSQADCDPEGQARHFAKAATELNVIAGMCVGHDAMFFRHTLAPATCLLVRDLRLRHNPAGALYNRRSYFRAALRAAREPQPTIAFQGWNDALLDSTARAVRDAGLQRTDPPCRVEEIMDFCRRTGVRHLGIAFCVGFREEAAQLDATLANNGFRVTSICCKSGSVPKDRLGIREEEKVRPGQAEMICNPLAQAELLDREQVELVLLLGQCVGHDSATIAHLRIPAVYVVAKDRVLAHNTFAAFQHTSAE